MRKGVCCFVRQGLVCLSDVFFSGGSFYSLYLLLLERLKRVTSQYLFSHAPSSLMEFTAIPREDERERPCGEFLSTHLSVNEYSLCLIQFHLLNLFHIFNFKPDLQKFYLYMGRACIFFSFSLCQNVKKPVFER